MKIKTGFGVETEARSLLMRLRVWTTYDEALGILHDLLVELEARRQHDSVAA